MKSINNFFSKQSIILLFGSGVSLLAGTLIYVLFRTTSLRIFSWSELVGIRGLLNKSREYSISYIKYVPDWILFSLPDGLWIFSYICFTLYIWKGFITVNNIVWFIIVPFIAIGSEILQLFQLLPGTFDITDLLFYLIGFILPFIIFKKSIIYKFKNQNYEQTF
ncbi:hypothetical protein [Apibacter sp. HY039]|uniref:hypothetical protein n=1 Tax=Apibacter sp. HY039 TaxID=2501476 RepID=UPI002102025F|nr:hypothetical protein [Apibacter sp. HY039]